MPSRRNPTSFPDELVDHHAPYLVWGLWAFMTITALLTALFFSHTNNQAQGSQSWGGLGLHVPTSQIPGLLANAAFPAAAAFAFTLAVRRIRGRTRIADGFFSLVLLNPLLVAKSSAPFDPTLLAAGLLGLMAGAIIAMKHNHYLRYLAVAVLALTLTRLSESFLMLLPALVAWLLLAGYTLARSTLPNDRVRGFAIIAAAEIALLIFGLACILVPPTSTPQAGSLFNTIVSFTEFPLLVLAIVMLALGWRTKPRPKLSPSGQVLQRKERSPTPPHFPGMLALLVGMLTMLLNNFQAGTLPPPGADQTALILCLLYTVFALHGPRRLQMLTPPMLLVWAAAYTIFR